MAKKNQKKRQKKRPAQLVKAAWPAMPEAQFQEYLRYIRWVGDKLGLRDWTFTLNRFPLPADSQVIACVDCVFGRRRASVTLEIHFAELDPETQRHTLVHELLHCHLDTLHSLWCNELPGIMGAAAWAVLDNASRQQIEFAVDGISDFLAPQMPLPKQVK